MTNTQKKILMLILLICGCVLTGIITELSSKFADDNSKNSIPVEEMDITPKKTLIRVYVSGAVVKPGLYDVPLDSRADDAITNAGGFTELADMERVNIAKKLKDGMQINVPTRKLNKASTKNNEKKSMNTTDSVKKIDTKKTQDKSINVININTASATELEQLPGIGPAMAQRIIAFRENGKLKSVEDLLKIKGIGKSKLGQIKEYVRTE